MVDWPGLLKFSLNHSDGTKKSQFKQMDQQNKKWLLEAITHYSTNQIRRIQQILVQLNKDQLLTEQDEQKRNQYLDQLEQLIQSLDRGDTLYQLGGHLIIFNIMFNSKYKENRLIAMRILCFANQNDAKVQQQSIKIGAFECLDRCRLQEDLQIKQGMFSVMCNIVRGENLEAKRIFIQIKGLQFVKDLLLKNLSLKIKVKSMNLIKDLLYYDDNLNRTFNDLSSFTNTNSIKNKNKDSNLLFDANKQISDNFLEKNQKYKGMIKAWLKNNVQVKQIYEQWCKEQEQ